MICELPVLLVEKKTVDLFTLLRMRMGEGSPEAAEET